MPPSFLTVPGSRLVLFSTDRERWYPSSRFVRLVEAGDRGAFSAAGLPFGTYYAAALGGPSVPSEEPCLDKEYLAALAPRATTVTIRDGQKQSIDLRISGR